MLLYKKTFFHFRDTSKTIRSRPIVQTLENLIPKIDSKYKGISIILAPQAPLLSNETIIEAIDALIINDSDSCIVVKEIDDPLFQRSLNGLTRINNKGFLLSDFDKVFLDTRACIITKNMNIKSGNLIGTKIIAIEAQNKETYYLKSKIDLEFLKFLQNKDNDKKIN